jgi:hypothetical protein
VALCGVCGVTVAEARNGRVIHLDAIPKGYPPHDVEPVDAAPVDSATRLRGAAEDMLIHHISGHPESDCAFAQNLRRALGVR